MSERSILGDRERQSPLFRKEVDRYVDEIERQTSGVRHIKGAPFAVTLRGSQWDNASTMSAAAMRLARKGWAITRLELLGWLLGTDAPGFYLELVPSTR